MTEVSVLTYTINDPLELNLSYMPFINNGGIFIPTSEKYHIGEVVLVDLQLPTKKDILRIEGKIVWITPKNALHHVLPGIGVQFMGSNVNSLQKEIEALLDPAVEVGGYTYGITEERRRDKK